MYIYFEANIYIYIYIYMSDLSLSLCIYMNEPRGSTNSWLRLCLSATSLSVRHQSVKPSAQLAIMARAKKTKPSVASSPLRLVKNPARPKPTKESSWWRLVGKEELNAQGYDKTFRKQCRKDLYKIENVMIELDRRRADRTSEEQVRKDAFRVQLQLRKDADDFFRQRGIYVPYEDPAQPLKEEDV
jgi:hypothetical protein